ncbi:MAG: twin-arginine translocation signal domain-containing protein, partial [Nonomuraea sp.]|nr:twin-arginine translocation signal domain-containing protein [Nonomuraea sp.]
MTGLSRREFLGAAALAAAVPSPDVFELRVRWCSISVQPTTDPLLAAARGYVRTGDPALGRRAAADLDAYRRRYYRAD